jgi:hypothetical protein
MLYLEQKIKEIINIYEYTKNPEKNRGNNHEETDSVE